MKLGVPGCSGGFGGELRSVPLLLDHDTLIDAGTGVGDRSISELAQIDRLFVKPWHRDQVTSKPIAVKVRERRPRMLQNNQVFEYQAGTLGWNRGSGELQFVVQ